MGDGILVGAARTGFAAIGFEGDVDNLADGGDCLLDCAAIVPIVSRSSGRTVALGLLVSIRKFLAAAADENLGILDMC